MTDDIIMIDMTLENMDDFKKVVFKMPRWAKWLIFSLITLVIALIVISSIKSTKIGIQDETIKKVADNHLKAVEENERLRKIKLVKVA